MNWRVTLTLVLLAGALFSGWAAWQQKDALVTETATDGDIWLMTLE